MSLKTWAKAPRPKTEEVNEFWQKHGGPPATADSLGDSLGGRCFLHVGLSCNFPQDGWRALTAALVNFSSVAARCVASELARAEISVCNCMALPSINTGALYLDDDEEESFRRYKTPSGYVS